MSKTSIDQGRSDVSKVQTGEMQEPKILDKKKLECPVCSQVFDSRQDYDSHWLSCHQDIDFSMASGSMGSMNPSGEGQCVEKTAGKE